MRNCKHYTRTLLAEIKAKISFEPTCQPGSEACLAVRRFVDRQRWLVSEGLRCLPIARVRPVWSSSTMISIVAILLFRRRTFCRARTMLGRLRSEAIVSRLPPVVFLDRSLTTLWSHLEKPPPDWHARRWLSRHLLVVSKVTEQPCAWGNDQGFVEITCSFFWFKKSIQKISQ